MMHSPLRILHVEDSERDATLVSRHLSRAGYALSTNRVDTAEAMRDALRTESWDAVLCDYSLPNFSALTALGILKELAGDIPFIIISGTVGEAVAVEAMRAGAHDYLMKDNLVRLVPTLERELQEAENRRARRAAEEQLRLTSAALQAAANAILITDREGRILWVNPAFTLNTGYSFEEVQGKNPRILKSGKQSREFYREMWDTILAGKRWRRTLVNRRKDGVLYTEDMTIAPIRDTDGAITHFVGIKQDITELVQALADLQARSDELKTMTQQLWQSSKLATMGELAASVAHELNNPLATLALHAESLIAQLPEDDTKHRSVSVMQQEIDRMATLVRNLLLFSRRSHPQTSTVDIVEELGNSLEFLHYFLRSHNITVVTEFTNDLPCVLADRQQLRQLFVNLLTNASDAMPNGGTLRMRASEGPAEKDRRTVAIEFVDSGIGIVASDLSKIWEPFFTTKPEGKGTGLGLPICRRTVEEHHGVIDIESQPGEGTTVRVILPAISGGTA